MRCPRCESTQLRKNGISSGKQQYLCKACGKRFIEPLPDTLLPSVESEIVQVVNNGHSEPALTEAMSSLLSHPEALILQTEQATISAQSAQGIAILLLDAENLKLDINAEKFLVELSNYPLQVKIAFANWRNSSIGKQDAELYERGYQLIHAPEGKNSADAQMIAMGASISRHYPDAKEVFVCSSDWLLTNLCNELQSQGMVVYRVRRQDNTLSIENRSTEENRHYSLTQDTEIPSFENLTQKIEELLKSERESMDERIARLSNVALLFQERRRLTIKENHLNSSPIIPQEKSLIAPLVEQKSNPPSLEQTNLALKVSATTLPALSARSINSKEELEQTLIEIVDSMKVNFPQEEVSVGKLSAALHKVGGEAANSIVKKLKLATNFTKFLQSCSTFTLKKSGQNYEVAVRKGHDKGFIAPS